MAKCIRRVSTLAAGALLVLALAAVPAHATLTPVNSAFTGSSRDAVFTIDYGGGLVARLRCTATSVAGRTNGTGSAVSANFFFSLPCSEQGVFNASLTITSMGNFTIAVSSSTAGSNASADLTLDSGFALVFNSFWCDFTFRGPQGPFTGAVTFDQATQVLTFTVRGLVQSGRGCSSSNASFTGTFTMNPRVTVS